MGRALSYTIGEYTCQAQVARYKRAFLKAVLRQDVAWCGGARREDAPALALATPSRREVRYESARPEELSARIADGMAKVEKGLGGSVFVLFEGVGYGVGGLVVGLIYQPAVAGITLATVPLLILPASALMYVLQNGSQRAGCSGEPGGAVPQPSPRPPRRLKDGQPGVRHRWRGRRRGAACELSSH